MINVIFLAILFSNNNFKDILLSQVYYSMSLEFFLYNSFIFGWFRWCVQYDMKLFLPCVNHFTVLTKNLVISWFWSMISDFCLHLWFHHFTMLFLFVFLFLVLLWGVSHYFLHFLNLLSLVARIHMNIMMS